MLETIKKHEDVCNEFYSINGHADLDHVGNNYMSSVVYFMMHRIVTKL